MFLCIRFYSCLHSKTTGKQVCRKFNDVGSRLLSRGFIQLEKRHAAIYKRVKSLLPRRESERKVHPLARHCDILQAVETRISMLNMTYMKYIESNLLCFIPGKVLDEMTNILNLVESDYSPPRTHQLLQELRDLSSMAMEHFDEHILPRVKETKEQLDNRRHALFASTYSVASTSTLKQVRPLFVQHSKDMQKIKTQYKVHRNQISYLNHYTQKLVQKLKKQNTHIKAQSIKLRDQERKIQEQSTKIQEQEATLVDIKKHLDEWDQKYKDLTAELIRARDDILLKTSTTTSAASKPLTNPTITRSLSPPKFFKTTIKPRMAQVLPKSLTNLQLELDLERKRKSNLLPDIPVKIRSIEQNEETTKSDSSTDTESSKSKVSYLIENLIKTPLTGLKSRKRKIADDIDLQYKD